MEVLLTKQIWDKKGIKVLPQDSFGIQEPTFANFQKSRSIEVNNGLLQFVIDWQHTAEDITNMKVYTYMTVFHLISKYISIMKFIFFTSLMD